MRLAAILCLFLVSITSMDAQNFHVEEDIKNQVALPNGVLKLLRNNEYVRQGCIRNDEFKPKTDFSGKWFQAGRVDLNGDKLADYVVKANEGCLRGANIGPFWIFRGTQRGYKLVLQLHELAMSVDKNRTKGYRHIGTVSLTAVKGRAGLWVFNGSEYVLRKTRTFDL
jgi:hypothetical protein